MLRGLRRFWRMDEEIDQRWVVWGLEIEYCTLGALTARQYLPVLKLYLFCAKLLAHPSFEPSNLRHPRDTDPCQSSKTPGLPFKIHLLLQLLQLENRTLTLVFRECRRLIRGFSGTTTKNSSEQNTTKKNIPDVLLGVTIASAMILPTSCFVMLGFLQHQHDQ